MNQIIKRWLNQSPEAEKLEVLMTEDEIAVISPSVESADLLWQSLNWESYPPNIAQKNVVIWAEGRLFANTANVRPENMPPPNS